VWRVCVCVECESVLMSHVIVWCVSVCVFLWFVSVCECYISVCELCVCFV